MKPRQTQFNKTTTKTLTNHFSIKTKSGKILSAQVGDVLLATLYPEGPDDLLFKCRMVDVKDGIVSVYVLDPQYNLVDLTIKENRIVSVEKPN